MNEIEDSLQCMAPTGATTMDDQTIPTIKK